MENASTGSSQNLVELIVFVLYLLCMIGIGIYFFIRTKNGGEKDYFLGGRKMGAWVSALSAGASDMSAWVLMGLPTSVFALGLGQTWIAIGLAIGYALSWILEAPRLRNKTSEYQNQARRLHPSGFFLFFGKSRSNTIKKPPRTAFIS